MVGLCWLARLGTITAAEPVPAPAGTHDRVGVKESADAPNG